LVLPPGLAAQLFAAQDLEINQAQTEHAEAQRHRGCQDRYTSALDDLGHVKRLQNQTDRPCRSVPHPTGDTGGG
jgi:hypothetical protein